MPSKRKIFTAIIIIAVWFIYSGITTASKKIYKEELYKIFATTEHKEKIKEPSANYANALSNIEISPSSIERANKIAHIKIAFDLLALLLLSYSGACLIHRSKTPESA
jgi:hypothetical protein